MPRKGASAVQVWTGVPVASRTVNVNDKTGFSLTAGSYVVRASSFQRGTIAMASTNTGSASPSSVTTTRAHLTGGLGANGSSSNASDNLARHELAGSTTINATRGSSTGTCTTAWELLELF